MFLKRSKELLAKSLFWRRFTRLPVAVKVTLWYTVLLTLLFVVILGFTAKFAENFRVQALGEELRKQVEKAARHPNKFDDYEEGIYLALYDSKGNRLKGRMPSGLPAALPVKPEQGIQRFLTGEQEYHYYDARVYSPQGEERWLRGAVSINGINRRGQFILLGLVVAMPFFILLAALGGYKIIKRGFQPVKTISATASAIGETGDLSRRIDIGPGQDELHQMAAVFNQMLGHLENSLTREKQFSGDVSHELRTPVSVIMAESEYGRDCITSPEEAKESFASIYRQSQHMAALINQLLDLARLGNKTRIEKTQLDFSQLVQDVLADYQLLAQGKKISLQAEVQPGLQVLGQGLLLRQILTNYLDNALKFTQTAIKVKLQQQAGGVVLSVTDDGPGLAREETAKIWERFYQTDAARNKKSNKGSGLGLAKVAAIAALHGGRVWVESEEGKGSTFYLAL